VLHKLFIPLVLGLVLAPPALSQSTPPSLLMPGVTYSKRVQFTPHGPVVLNVITTPKPGGLYSLQPVLSNESILGREKVTDMQRRLSAGATVAGVNGDLFNWNDGHPSGVLMRNGVLDHAPLSGRTSVGIATDGILRLDRVGMLGFWRGTGQRQRLALNASPNANGFSLFTPAYAPTTPAVTNATEVVLHPFPAVTPNADLVGVVADVVMSSQGRTAIPPDGVVIQARGTAAARLVTDAPLGTTITVRFTLNPTWDGVVGAVGGGPIIVAGGKPVFRANEDFTASQLSPRNPRTAVGQRADGKILLVAADGRVPGYSVGLTNFELALAMMQLGAVSASALDAGGSTTMAFDGRLLNRPSDAAGERPVAEALLLSYTGVYVPPLADTVLSPNGDGSSETQSLAYKVVRPSVVQATLYGPGGVTLPMDAGDRTPGIYRFTWAGSTPEGGQQPEGTWRFSVTATDDQAQSSTAERTFTLNNTLASLTARPAALRLRKKGVTRLTTTFELERASLVTVTIETAKEIVVRQLARKSMPAGSYTLTWNGRNSLGGLAYGGSYQVHVAASNALGRVDLRAPFTARR
jgi:flagellar hook assembly protein FlgD